MQKHANWSRGSLLFACFLVSNWGLQSSAMAQNEAGNVMPTGAAVMTAPKSQAQRQAAQRQAAQENGETSIKTWAAPGSVEEAIEERKKDRTPAHVRLGVQLVPYQKQTFNNQQQPGESIRFIPGKPLRRTLRSQINRPNHFFVGDWHIETVPLTWDRQQMNYAVRVKVHRRYGAFGQLEEFIGSVDVQGRLVKQEDRLFVLQGRTARQFRDRMQNPFLDLVAGDGPVLKVPQPTGEISKGPQVERAQRPQPKNARSGSPYIRGRL